MIRRVRDNYRGWSSNQPLFSILFAQNTLFTVDYDSRYKTDLSSTGKKG